MSDTSPQDPGAAEMRARAKRLGCALGLFVGLVVFSLFAWKLWLLSTSR
jgi:hypothetical protein